MLLVFDLNDLFFFVEMPIKARCPRCGERIHGKKLVVMSYNMSWAVQKNVVDGSEIEYVDRVARFGDASMVEGIAACTSNALETIRVVRPTILGVQEAQTRDFCDRYIKWFASTDAPHELRACRFGSKNSAYYDESKRTGVLSRLKRILLRCPGPRVLRGVLQATHGRRQSPCTPL